MANAGDRVRFNVGGKMFETTATTLANAGRGSMLGTLLDDDWNLRRPPDGAAAPGGVPEYFIDRNPECFGVLLDLLRTGELHSPPSVSDRLLHREALFYGLLPHVQAARWGPFDGNLLRLAHSVHGLALGGATAIRAAPDGGCCVAHGSLAHVYDWTLEEHHPLNFDYRYVNNIGYVDSSHIVLTAYQFLSKAPGLMGLFSLSTGELCHRFQVSHDNQFKSFTAGALAFDRADCRIFASCKGGCNEYGIGVWDQITGQQVDFFYEQPGYSLGYASKLQWLNGSKCLMVAKLYPGTQNKKFIGLLDFREKRMAWSWVELPSYDESKENKVLDAIAMEDERSVCVVDRNYVLGFLDLRVRCYKAQWMRSQLNFLQRRVNDLEAMYPKLAVHEGQLFCSMHDSISVFCGPQLLLTSSIRAGHGGSIRNFSIGGGRLFALHDKENVFDVWEMPPPPIL